MSAGLRPERFSREEAESKLGGGVRAAADFTDIPAGTTGRVIGVDEVECGGFELIVEWDLRVGGKLQHDWFTKENYRHSLVELVESRQAVAPRASGDGVPG
jgi:hypothetical protein